MIGFVVSFLSWLASTLVPAFLGMLLIIIASHRIKPRYLAAFAFGILFWFFVDTIGGSAVLDVNSGFGGGLAQVGVVALFLAGVILFFWLDRNRDILSPRLAYGKFGLSIPFLVAIAVGIHGLGEGLAFGTTAYSTTSASLLDAVGGLTPGVAYVLHKGLEPMMIGACYNIYSPTPKTDQKRTLRNVGLLSLVFAIPSLLGASVGYFVAVDTTYFFALGTGTAIYAAFRIAGPLFTTEGESSSRDSIKIALAWTTGIMAIYVAALFHS